MKGIKHKYLDKLYISLLLSLLIYFIYKSNIIRNKICLNKCSEYHIFGESKNWNFFDFIIEGDDTIWIDKQCYYEWCICIDECNPGQCCSDLNK